MIRRICTIHGRAYTMTGHCTVCGDPTWTTMDTPTARAGCTATQCLQNMGETSSPSPPPPILRFSSDNDFDDEDEATS